MDEISAIVDAPDTTTRLGIRDRAMLHLCFAAALRVSELVTAQVADLSLRGTASLRVHGKGRRERCLRCGNKPPLTSGPGSPSAARTQRRSCS